MPMILATRPCIRWLTRKGLRTFCSINVRSAECIDPHYFAVLIGSGATTVNPYLAQDSIADRIDRGLLDGSLTDAMRRYRDAIDAGLLKIMSKMGISVISSYRGGLNFEAVGLSPRHGGRVFPRHAVAHLGHRSDGRGAEAGRGPQARLAGWADVLPIGGFYKARRSGEKHAWEAQTMHMLQSACDRASYDLWKQYSAAMRANPPIHLRDLAGHQDPGQAGAD
jgi:glutamate synthase (NADPH/NADH) large chain